MSAEVTLADETPRINELADELNQEAEDVLEYQVIWWHCDAVTGERFSRH